MNNQFVKCVLPTLVLGLLSPASGQAQKPVPALPIWDTMSDTWVGTDALGRVLPGPKDAGAPRLNKTVGMFYFLTFDSGGDGPYDNTKILKAHPEAIGNVHNPAWGPLNAAHYWGEPLFGYYASDDEWALRKHATMLANSGVDVVIFDNSNAVTYDRARRTLCKVWEDIRRHGGKTPQIAFLCPFGNAAGIGSLTLSELYDTLYAPGLYSDLWFRWEGKPLVMAYPSYADAAALQSIARQPTELTSGGTLGQKFTAEKPIVEAGGEFPTWATATSGMTLSLFADGPGGMLLAHKKFANVKDNAAAVLTFTKALPAGKYYLEMSRAVGHIGWWGHFGSTVIGSFDGGEPVTGSRSVLLRYSGDQQAMAIPVEQSRPDAASEHARKIRDFFTFRTPIAPYDVANPPPGGWAWLQNFPQAPQLSPDGKVEQITVGVAQNYNAVTHLAAMSIPGAFGRSYHNGKLDTRPDAVRKGYNFAEQWNRALQIDPPFIFITGWNEWTAGFYEEWNGYKAPPAIFVDEFNQEYSRDIEPMLNGHGDDYYYQLVSNVRRYKGVRTLPPVTPHKITMDGNFDAWKKVEPEYRDVIGDTAHRNAPGYGHAGPYVNTTGRNDIVASKVTFDAKNVTFYVRTQDNMTSHTDPDWMLLYINVGADYSRGWLGYNFVINRKVGDNTTSLERNVGGKYAWEKVADVRYVVRENEMAISVPRAALGITDLPMILDFKWADHCYAKGDWSDFTLNGDAAPDDRFNYRATLQGKF